MAQIYCNGEHAWFPEEDFEDTVEFGRIHITANPHTVNGDPINATSWALPSVAPPDQVPEGEASVEWTSVAEATDLAAAQEVEAGDTPP